MVTVAFGIAVSAAGGTAAGLGLGTYALIAAGGMLASYVDQTLVYPALFGKKNPRPDALEGFQVSTTDPGAPRWEVYGSRAWVPCHYLWSLNIREEVTGGTVGKGGGGRPFVQVVRADVGLAVCDGPIAEIDTLYANERPFWSRQFNRVVLEDHRWAITADVPNGSIRIEATDADVTDFAGVFDAGEPSLPNDGDVVRLERVAPSTLQGYYRVAGVAPHSGAQRSVIAIRPLRGQPIVSGTAGSIFEPAALRRIDQGVASHTWFVGVSGSALALRRPSNDPGIPGTPTEGESELTKVWVPGGVYRLDGFAPSTVNGLYRLQSRLTYSPSVGGTGIPSQDYVLILAPLEGQPTGSITGAGTSTAPGIITRDSVVGSSGTDGRGFVFADDAQEFVSYQGTLDQPQDPTLAAIEPDAPAHRGIAHMSLKDWNWGPHGNAAPVGLTALVRARSGETVAAAIDRICRRSVPDGHVDVSKLRTKALLGHSVPGGMPSGQALQPIAVMHGVAMQDRGGVLTFLDERDLPIVAVATRHLNARPDGERSGSRGFVANRIDKADIPERVVIQYVDPGEGENEADGAGLRAPELPDRGKRDTLQINLRPLVVWGYEVKRRARELLRRVRLESYRGQIRLPPNYMDVLPGTCLTFQSNDEQEEILPAGVAIAYDTTLRDILPRSLAVRVRFANGQVATLVDNGLGAIEGFPAGIEATVNDVDYSAGRIDLTCDEDLDLDEPPRITYRYERQWLVRVNKATLAGHDFGVECEVVSTTTDNPLPPLPRELRTGLGGAIVSETPIYRTRVLDVPSLYAGQFRSVWFYVVAAPEPGSAWRGAVVYQSPNGVDRWSPIGQIQTPTVMGTVPVNNLPTSVTGANPGVIDWATELVVDLPGGETLTDATTEMIAYGQNWLLVGEEIIAFHEAESAGGTEWTLRGLVRGLRHTILAMDSHADGDPVAVLTLLGVHGLFYEPPGGAAAANRTYHLRIVPSGASIDAVPTVSQLVRGRSMLPAPPQVEQGMLTQVGNDLVLTWARRSMDQTTLFGPSPLQEGEQYLVVAFDLITASTLVGSLGLEGAIDAATKKTWQVTPDQDGSPYVRKSIAYKQADMLAHGFVLGVTPVGFVVYQVGMAGRSERSAIVFLTPV